MFGKDESGTTGRFDTLVGMTTAFEGNVESEGTIRVDGKVKGDLKAAGDIIVGPSARITGNLDATNVHLSGIVEGNIHSNGVLRLFSTAKLYGNIHAHAFVADEGGIFQGRCSIVEPRGSGARGGSATSSARDSSSSSSVKRSKDLDTSPAPSQANGKEKAAENTQKV